MARMPARSKTGFPACPRQALQQVIDASPYSYAELSRMIGRDNGYLRRFVKGPNPVALTAEEHGALLDFFGLEPVALGERELWVGR